jgi:hypothetical protein
MDSRFSTPEGVLVICRQPAHADHCTISPEIGGRRSACKSRGNALVSSIDYLPGALDGSDPRTRRVALAEYLFAYVTPPARRHPFSDERTSLPGHDVPGRTFNASAQDRREISANA